MYASGLAFWPRKLRLSPDQFFFTFSGICSGYCVRVNSSPKLPKTMVISVSRPSRRNFLISYVSNTGGPFPKFSAPNVTNNTKVTKIDHNLKNSQLDSEKTQGLFSTNSVEFCSSDSAAFNFFTMYTWIFAIIGGPRSKASMPNAAARVAKSSLLFTTGLVLKTMAYRLAFVSLGFCFLFLPPGLQFLGTADHLIYTLLSDDHPQLLASFLLPAPIATLHQILPCSFRPLMAFEVSDHAAGNSARSISNFSVPLRYLGWV